MLRFCYLILLNLGPIIVEPAVLCDGNDCAGERARSCLGLSLGLMGWQQGWVSGHTAGLVATGLGWWRWVWTGGHEVGLVGIALG